jgi:uncharacterized protein
MLLLAAIGIPMYVCATASIPIAITFMMKGFSPGVVFVFLASGPATNAASLSIIVKTLGKKTAILFVAVITVFSIIFGYILDGIFSLTHIDPNLQIKHLHSHNPETENVFFFIISIIFLILIFLSFYRKYIKNKIKKEEIFMPETKKIMIEGMTCNHCVANVKRAISQTSGVDNVVVDLNDKCALIDGDFDMDKIVKAIEDVGYKVVNS